MSLDEQVNEIIEDAKRKISKAIRDAWRDEKHASQLKPCNCLPNYCRGATHPDQFCKKAR